MTDETGLIRMVSSEQIPCGDCVVTTLVDAAGNTIRQDVEIKVSKEFWAASSGWNQRKQ